MTGGHDHAVHSADHAGLRRCPKMRAPPATVCIRAATLAKCGNVSQFGQMSDFPRRFSPYNASRRLWAARPGCRQPRQGGVPVIQDFHQTNGSRDNNFKKWLRATLP
jgi:hypothetical protein